MLLPSEIISMVDAELEELGASRSTLAGLTGLGVGTVSDLLNGVRPPDIEYAQKMHRWLSGLRKLVDACKPLRLSFKETGILRDQIESLEKGTLQISVFQREPPAEILKGYCVRLRNGHYFSYRDKQTKTVMGSMNLMSGAAVFIETTAKQLVEKLTEIGCLGSSLQINRFASEDSVRPTLDNVWCD